MLFRSVEHQKANREAIIITELPYQVNKARLIEKFAELVERDGIIPAPYVARYHWVSVEKADALAEDELEDLISKSYLMVFQKLPLKVRSSLSK